MWDQGYHFCLISFLDVAFYMTFVFKDGFILRFMFEGFDLCFFLENYEKHSSCSSTPPYSIYFW